MNTRNSSESPRQPEIAIAMEDFIGALRVCVERWTLLTAAVRFLSLASLLLFWNG